MPMFQHANDNRWKQTGDIWHKGDAPPAEKVITQGVQPEYRNRLPNPSFDAQGHQLAKEFAAPDEMLTAWLTNAEQQERTIQFQGGKLLDQTGNPLDSKSADSLSVPDGRGRETFTMLPSGQFVHANAIGEIQRLDPGFKWRRDAQGNPDMETTTDTRRFHHTSLAQGQDVAGAGEMAIDQGQLVKLDDSSGHYKPDPMLTRQVVSKLSSEGVPIEQAELKLGKKGIVPEVRGSALEILGYEHGEKDIQWKMLVERAKKKNVLDEIEALGASDAVQNDQIVPSLAFGPRTTSAPEDQEEAADDAAQNDADLAAQPEDLNLAKKPEYAHFEPKSEYINMPEKPEHAHFEPRSEYITMPPNHEGQARTAAIAAAKASAAKKRRGLKARINHAAHLFMDLF